MRVQNLPLKIGALAFVFFVIYMGNILHQERLVMQARLEKLQMEIVANKEKPEDFLILDEGDILLPRRLATTVDPALMAEIKEQVEEIPNYQQLRSEKNTQDIALGKDQQNLLNEENGSEVSLRKGNKIFENEAKVQALMAEIKDLELKMLENKQPQQQDLVVNQVASRDQAQNKELESLELFKVDNIASPPVATTAWAFVVPENMRRDEEELSAEDLDNAKGIRILQNMKLPVPKLEFDYDESDEGKSKRMAAKTDELVAQVH